MARRPSLPLHAGVASAFRDDPRAALIAAELAERLPVVQARAALEAGPQWTPRSDVPQSRADCVDGPRPCPHVHCRHHLWLQVGDDRAGRRYGGSAPESTVRPAWLQDPPPPSCSLDLADAVAQGKAMTVAAIATAVGVRASQLAVILATAIRKLKAAGVKDRLREFDEP